MPDMTWQPTEGPQTKGFLDRITDFGDPQKQILKNESFSVIRAGAEPGTGRQKVGLVVGYVQSGKTMSLTCVSAMARDNGYGHIIILCGVTKELFKQNMERVRKDLAPRTICATRERAEAIEHKTAGMLRRLGWEVSQG